MWVLTHSRVLADTLSKFAYHLDAMSTEDQEVIQTEQVEAPDSTEELDLELEDESSDEQVEDSKVDESDKKKPKSYDEMSHEELLAKVKEFHGRLKKPTKKPETKAQPQVNSNPDVLTREEAILIAKGYSDEELKVLNKLKKAEPTKSLVELADDEMFSAWKAKRDREAKAEKAKLGASRGSSQTRSEVKPGMTAEEHRKIWESQQ